MTKKICAIHQPNFFPWLGYFNKIERSDIFIFLDNVQFSKQTWTTRVKVLDGGESKWLSCPIQLHFGQKIKDVSLKNHEDLKTYVIGRLQSIYRKSPYFQQGMNIVEQVFLVKFDNLADFNIYVIKTLLAQLKIKTQTIRQSEMHLEKELKATPLLAELCLKLNADSYLCGGGSQGYQEDELFKNKNIELIYQQFKEPMIYPDYVGGLSIIDCLMNCGLDQTIAYVKASAK